MWNMQPSVVAALVGYLCMAAILLGCSGCGDRLKGEEEKGDTLRPLKYDRRY